MFYSVKATIKRQPFFFIFVFVFFICGNESADWLGNEVKLDKKNAVLKSDWETAKPPGVKIETFLRYAVTVTQR